MHKTDYEFAKFIRYAIYQGVMIVDLDNMTASKIHDLIKNHSKSIKDDEWLKIDAWISKFLKSNPPLKEKRMFVPLGCAETVTIMCDGIIRWRNSICIKCKKQEGFEKFSCSIYHKNEKLTGGIPNKIWASDNICCPHFEEVKL